MCPRETRARSRNQGQPDSIQHRGRTWLDATASASAGEIPCRAAPGWRSGNVTTGEGPRHCRGLWPVAVANGTGARKESPNTDVHVCTPRRLHAYVPPALMKEAY